LTVGPSSTNLDHHGRRCGQKGRLDANELFIWPESERAGAEAQLAGM